LYLDTGAMYRAVALAADRKGIGPKDGKKLDNMCSSLDLLFKTDEDPPRLFLDKEDISIEIRRTEMDMLSSIISNVKEVRIAMTDIQRRMAKGQQIVAEGRDMGTVVFPKADHKFFLKAEPEVRAERRYRERLAKGEAVTKTTVKADLEKRDSQDETRSLAPLIPAEDAKVIDSTSLTPEEVVDKMLGYIKKK